MSSPEQKNPCNEGSLHALAASQHGVLTAAQAAQLGFAAPALSRRVRAGVVERMLPGVYRLTSVPISARQAAMAALLWAGDDAVVSHVTAGALWALDGLQAERVDLWVPSRRAPRSPLVEVHRGTVDAIDRRRVESIWVTSPARTLIDLAAVLEAEVLETALESALRRGLTTPGSIERRLMSLGGRGRRGTGQLRALIDDRGKGAALEFELEVRIWRLLRSAGLRPVRQYSVRYDGRTYRLDFA